MKKTTKDLPIDIEKLKLSNKSLSEIPPSIVVDASNENETIFSFINYTVRTIQDAMIDTIFLTYDDVIVLYQKYAKRLEEIKYAVSEVKLNEAIQYLNDKLFIILNIAFEQELFETIHNVNMWLHIKKQLLLIDFI